MSLKLKSKKSRNKIFIFSLLVSAIISLTVYLLNIPWNNLDYRLSDAFYKRIVKDGKGPENSKRIVYLNIADKSYNLFNSNYLNRAALAEINNILLNLNANSVCYDMIFPRSSFSYDDSIFAQSISELGNVYLPAGFKLNNSKTSFRWETGLFFTQLKDKYLLNLKTYNQGNPYYAQWVLPQKDIFANAAYNSGHISVVNDQDGVIRHNPLVIKIDSLYFPAISLSIFLDYNRIPFNKVEINWGSYIKIPAIPEGFLEEDIFIPIDEEGKIYIPYFNFWGDGNTKMLEVQNLIEYSRQPELYDELLDLFEGNFVFISDVSVGTTDLGQTTLEEDVPLVSVHAAILNSLLTNTFLRKWNIIETALFIFPLGLILGLSSLTKSNLTLYISGLILTGFLIYFSYQRITDFILFPLFTVSVSVIVIFISILIGLYFFVQKEQTFIKNAFSKYVPSNVVNELLEKPELLKLGGEERELTILFSDLAGFTTIAESMNSTNLVSLLNEYLTEMTNIILQEGGTIDKYIGDAILAEFGAPIQMENHADASVSSALLMQRKMNELAGVWNRKNYPELKCRIGINTGNIILGNMGSEQVFDYTVIGDAVNLASRLEGANKFYNTDILISEFTYDNLKKDKFHTRVIDIIKVKGKNKAVKIYEVFGFSSEEIFNRNYYKFYEEAFNFYLAKDFARAKEYFRKSLEEKPEDSVSAGMLKRIEVFETLVLDEQWDGSFVMKEK